MRQVVLLGSLRPAAEAKGLEVADFDAKKAAKAWLKRDRRVLPKSSITSKASLWRLNELDCRATYEVTRVVTA